MNNSPLLRSASLSTALRAMFLLFLPLLGTLQAQQGRPMVAANFSSNSLFRTYEVTVMAIETPNGDVHGFMRLVDDFDDGTQSFVRVYEGAVEELTVIGDTAFIRAGNTFLALTQDAPGAANPGGFTPIFFLSTAPALAFVLPVLTFLPRIAVSQGNITVQG